jgi:hypothetical protein
MADTMSIDNKLNSNDRDESDESIESPQDLSAPAAGNLPSAGNPVSQDGQQPKRKGGRKPVRNPNTLSNPRARYHRRTAPCRAMLCRVVSPAGARYDAIGPGLSECLLPNPP